MDAAARSGGLRIAGVLQSRGVAVVTDRDDLAVVRRGERAADLHQLAFVVRAKARRPLRHLQREGHVDLFERRSFLHLISCRGVLAAPRRHCASLRALAIRRSARTASLWRPRGTRASPHPAAPARTQSRPPSAGPEKRRAGLEFPLWFPTRGTRSSPPPCSGSRSRETVQQAAPSV